MDTFKITKKIIDKVFDSEDPVLIRQLRTLLYDPYHTFTPRSDNPSNWDEQSSFVNDTFDGIKIALGGNGCIAGETKIYDPVQGKRRRIDQIKTPFNVISKSPNGLEIGYSSAPFVKGVTDLYDVELNNGERFTCTLFHRVLTEFGWLSVKHALSCEVPLLSISDNDRSTLFSGGRHCLKTIPGFQCGCHPSPCFCDEQLHCVAGNGQCAPPSLIDALAHNPTYEHAGGQVCESRYNHFCQQPCRLSNARSLCLERLDHALKSYSDSQSSRLASGLYIRKATFVRRDRFYDIRVSPHHNYLLGNTFHHNSGKTHAACYAVAKFLRSTPPPVDLCPFLMVSESKSMVGQIYQEKLKEFIPDKLIDNIVWFQRGRGWPDSVTLKPHKNGNRWVVDLRSYAMGEAEFRSLAAGGFYIDEPCPHNIVIELLARCRDWRLPGSKLYALTPLDPLPELEEYYNNRHEPHIKQNWKFYHLNTEENTKLADTQFLDDTPDEWKETRRIGAFASFVGAVFKEFNPAVHVVEPFEIPTGWVHFRAIDFGYNHPFGCLWAARDNDGRYYIYNEYCQPERLLAEHVEAINAYPWDESSPDYSLTFADWQAQERREIAKLGLQTTAARKDVMLGIECVKKHLKASGDDKPRLYIFNHCTELIRQMRIYRWHIASTRGLNPQAPKDAPVKNNDDLVDCLRYLIYSAENKGRKFIPQGLPPKLMNRKNRQSTLRKL